jgi:hypothetical protein
MVEATRLKKWYGGYLQWHHLPTKFHENQPIGSKVIRGGTHRHTNKHTDRQAGDFISLLSFLESRLKTMKSIRN